MTLETQVLRVVRCREQNYFKIVGRCRIIAVTVHADGHHGGDGDDGLHDREYGDDCACLRRPPHRKNDRYFSTLAPSSSSFFPPSSSSSSPPPPTSSSSPSSPSSSSSCSSLSLHRQFQTVAVADAVHVIILVSSNKHNPFQKQLWDLITIILYTVIILISSR